MLFRSEFIKRPGLVKATDIVSVTPPAYKQSQGLAEYNNKIIAMIDNTLYKVDPSTYAVSTLGTTSASTNQSYFVKTFLNNYLMMQNRNNGYLLKQDDTFTKITNDSVVSATIMNGGGNYSEGATVTFSAPTSGTTTTGEAVVTEGVITAIDIINHGSGYTLVPTITITPAVTKTTTGTGTSGEFTITVSDATGIYIGMDATGTGIGTVTDPGVYTNIQNSVFGTLGVATATNTISTQTTQTTADISSGFANILGGSGIKIGRAHV